MSAPDQMRCEFLSKSSALLLSEARLTIDPGVTASEVHVPRVKPMAPAAFVKPGDAFGEAKLDGDQVVVPMKLIGNWLEVYNATLQDSSPAIQATIFKQLANSIVDGLEKSTFEGSGKTEQDPFPGLKNLPVQVDLTDGYVIRLQCGQRPRLPASRAHPLILSKFDRDRQV